MNEKAVWVVGAVLHRPGEVLIVRRGPGQAGAGAWEFPGGKVDPGETPEAALSREILEELGVKIKVGACLGEEIYLYPHRPIRLRLYWATIESGEIVLSEHDRQQWLAPSHLIVEELSAADQIFVPRLCEQFPGMQEILHGSR